MQPSLSISIQGTTLVLGVDGHQVEASLTSNHRQYRAQAPPIVHHSYSQSQTHRNRHSQAPLFSPRHSGTSLPPSSGHRGRDWNRKSDGGLSKAYSQGLSPSSASKALSITAPNTPVTHSWHSSSPARPKILFYHHYDPHYGFTNFSPHPVVYNGKTYPTSEHLFQSFKFDGYRQGLADHIRTCSERPSVAFSEARRFAPEVRPDWMQINISKMDEVLYLKFTQNLDLKKELLDTGDAELIEDSDKDAFWGVGPDGNGKNELGKGLERLRTLLRQQGH